MNAWGAWSIKMYAKASTCDIKQEILQLNGSSKAKIRKASIYVKSYTRVYSHIMYQTFPNQHYLYWLQTMHITYQKFNIAIRDL